MTGQFIVYACPGGILGQQLEIYFAKSQSLCGPNAAHHYMPHCSLTGFFHARSEAVPCYLEALHQAYEKAIMYRSSPLFSPSIQVTGMEFHPDWHGLTLRSPWLHQLMAQFVQSCVSPSHRDRIRLKDWLHVSLAYEFEPEQRLSLQQIARELVNPNSPASWQLRFYRRDSTNYWLCYQTWELSA